MIANTQFNGFPKEIEEFYKELKMNNNKEWFHENKLRYEKVAKIPSHQLVNDMQIQFANNNIPYLADTKKSLFRVNRDIRFSNNKDPYKTNLGVFFPYISNSLIGKPVENPGIYVHYEDSENFIAGGLHAPQSDQLKAIRSKIANEWEELEDIINNKEFKKEFTKIFTEPGLKRVPAGYDANHPAAKYLKLKDYTIYTEVDKKIYYSAELTSVILHKAIIMEPLLSFLTEGLD